MKRWILAGAFAFAAVGQALAADLPEPPPARAPAAYVPVVAPVYNWGGVYFGVQGGYGIGTSDWTGANTVGSGSTGDFNTSGFVVGPTLGVNFQTDAFVFGIEGDVDASWMDGKSSNTFCGGLGFGPGAQCETKNTWFGTLRARAGYAADRVLFYATGGGAFGNIQSGANGGLQSTTKAGWTAGAGVEAAFTDNWTARLEYLFIDLQDGTCNTAAPCGLNAAGTAASQSVKFDASVIRLGLDYKFR